MSPETSLFELTKTLQSVISRCLLGCPKSNNKYVKSHSNLNHYESIIVCDKKNSYNKFVSESGELSSFKINTTSKYKNNTIILWGWFFSKSNFLLYLFTFHCQGDAGVSLGRQHKEVRAYSAWPPVHGEVCAYSFWISMNSRSSRTEAAPLGRPPQGWGVLLLDERGDGAETSREMRCCRVDGARDGVDPRRLG